jgi:membrane-associated protein
LDLIRSFFENVYNVQKLIEIGGLLGMFIVVYAETGLLIGFFLPGDSLLVTAGVFAARGDLDIVWLNLALMVAAIVGDATGYWIGYRAGMAIYKRPDSFFFRKKHLTAAHEFYEKHGGKTIILARFIPIIRTFAPFVAGMGKMRYLRFAAFNVFGGMGWIAGMTLAGYYLGNIPIIRRNFEKTVILIILISVLPIVWHAWNETRRKRV